MALAPLESLLMRCLPPSALRILVLGEPSQELVQALSSSSHREVMVTGWNAHDSSLETLPSPSVDSVLCLSPDILHQPHIILRALRSVLHPQSSVVAAFPNAQHHSRINALLRGYTDHPDLNKTLPLSLTYTSLIKLFLDAGFIPHLASTERNLAPPAWLRDMKPVFQGLGLDFLRTQHYLETTVWIVEGQAMPHVEASALQPMTISVCVSDESLFATNLLASPEVNQSHQLFALQHAPNAASAHNQAIRAAKHDWVLCVHQDVYLPHHWMAGFQARIRDAEQQYGRLDVVGVYGVANKTAIGQRCGCVVDRDRVLHEPSTLPHLVNSLDELLIAVRADSGLAFDPQLGWHFYGTDICLAAEQKGLRCAVVDAPCFHNSLSVDVPKEFHDSMKVFHAKWRHRLPIVTSCTEVFRQ